MAERYLIDVRTPAEFATGALGGATNIEFQNIAQFIVDQQNAAKDTEITLYCRSGRRSAIAKSELNALGFINVRDLGSFETARDVLEREARELTTPTSAVASLQKSTRTQADKSKLMKSTNVLLEGLKSLD